MVIQCTKELLKNMKREPEPIPDGELSEWQEPHDGPAE